MKRREEILGAIKREEARLADLEGEVERAKNRLATLRAELDAFRPEVPLPSTSTFVVRQGLPATQPRDAAEKVSATFESRLRALEELHARKGNLLKRMKKARL